MSQDVKSKSPKLTKREVEAMHHLGEGLTYKEIAISMDIELGTVKKHVHNVIVKLGAKNSAHAIKSIYATRHPSFFEIKK